MHVSDFLKTCVKLINYYKGFEYTSVDSADIKKHTNWNKKFSPIITWNWNSKKNVASHDDQAVLLLLWNSHLGNLRNRDHLQLHGQHQPHGRHLRFPDRRMDFDVDNRTWILDSFCRDDYRFHGPQKVPESWNISSDSIGKNLFNYFSSVTI